MALSLCAASPKQVVFKSTNTSNRYSSSSSASAGTGRVTLPGIENPRIFLKQKAKDLAERYEALVMEKKSSNATHAQKPINYEMVQIDGMSNSKLLEFAYQSCRDIFDKENDPHSTGTSSASGSLLLGEQKLKALWAIWAWARRIDEFVDGMNRSYATVEDMAQWEQRTVDAFNGRPWDIYDLALADTLLKIPIDIQLFYDLIEASKSDINAKKRFQNYDELCVYRYYGASSMFLMLVQICGVSPLSKVPLHTVYSWAITYSIGLMEVDDLRDIQLDAMMGRVYFAQDELALEGLTDAVLYSGKVTPGWINFMEKQITRTRNLITEGEKYINEMNEDSRWWTWTATLIYLQHLDAIKPGDDYKTTKIKLTSNAKVKKLWALVLAYAKSRNFI